MACDIPVWSPYMAPSICSVPSWFWGCTCRLKVCMVMIRVLSDLRYQLLSVPAYCSVCQGRSSINFMHFPNRRFNHEQGSLGLICNNKDYITHVLIPEVHIFLIIQGHTSHSSPERIREFSYHSRDIVTLHHLGEE